jgi:hypothetical protein
MSHSGLQRLLSGCRGHNLRSHDCLVLYRLRENTVLQGPSLMKRKDKRSDHLCLEDIQNLI